MPILVALVALNVLNPGRLLFPRRTGSGGHLHDDDHHHAGLPKLPDAAHWSSPIADLKESESPVSEEKI